MNKWFNEMIYEYIFEWIYVLVDVCHLAWKNSKGQAMN